MTAGRSIDVTTEIAIQRPPADVAAYAADPVNATEWYRNIKSVDLETEPPLRVGSRIRFTAAFLGRRLAYTYEVVEFAPGEHLVMRTADGPFLMETTYTWKGTDDGATSMTLRNRGRPSGFSAVAAPLIAASVRRETRKNLQALKRILERAW